MAERYGLDLLTASILARRGITEPAEICFMVEQDLRFMHNPFQFAEMEEAVDRILQAKYQKERVFIFGDRDVDGMTSIVLLSGVLDSMGIDAVWSLPTEDEPYGLSRKAVDECAAKDASLIITVDCGISNTEEIAYAGELGIDVIIIDHHNPQDNVPAALAVINPKMEDSGYPFRDLAGCAVVFKVAWALVFAQTDMYNHPICLIHVIPGNETYEIQAVKFLNLVETGRIVETLNPGMVSLEQTRLPSFLEGHELYVYQQEIQLPMLKVIFGKTAIIHVLDAAPEIWKEFPALSGKTLLRLKDISRMARYATGIFSEMETFINLFISFIGKRHAPHFVDLYGNLALPALGTIADMMPLVNENRIIVKQGLAGIAVNSPLGLKTLFSHQNFQGRQVTSTDIAWHISPLLNATGRMGVPDKAVKLLLSRDPGECDSLVQEITSLNEERKKLGDRIWETVFPLAEESFRETGEKLVLVSGENIHRGVTGILATRLLKFFKRPSIVAARMGETIIGSIRSMDGYAVTPLLDACAGFFYDYGGHDCAAGFSMSAERYEDFKAAVHKFAGDMAEPEKPDQEDEALGIDAELPLAFVTPDIIKAVDFFAPYGESNKSLTFLARGMTIKELTIVGKTEKQHVKMLLDTGAFKWPALYWNASSKVKTEFDLGDKVDIVFKVTRNYYQNAETLQLIIADLKRL